MTILKKIIPLLFIWLALQAPAQKFLDTSRPAKFTPRVNVYAGGGLSTISQNYDSEIAGVSDFMLSPGARITLGAEAQMWIRNYLGVGCAVDLSTNHYNWSLSILHTSQAALNTIYNRNTYNTVEIPLYLSLRFNVYNHLRWYNQLGLFFNHGISGTSKYQYHSSSTNSLGQSQVSSTHYKRDYYHDPDAIINGFNRTDIGLHLKTELEFSQRFTFSLQLRCGLRNTALNYGVLDVRTHNFSATALIGYTL